jgi:hypothetical protein
MLLQSALALLLLPILLVSFSCRDRLTVQVKGDDDCHEEKRSYPPPTVVPSMSLSNPTTATPASGSGAPPGSTNLGKPQPMPISKLDYSPEGYFQPVPGIRNGTCTTVIPDKLNLMLVYWM